MAYSAKQTIKQTFMKLLEENPFDKITVTDIVQRSNVNRNTFYYHFQDIYDLLDEILAEEAEKNLNPVNHSTNPDLQNTWIEEFLHSIQFIKENKRLTYHLYHSVCRNKVEDFLLKILQTSMYEVVKNMSSDLDIEDETLTILSQFYAFALTGVITDWLKNGMNYDLESYVLKIHQILDGNIYASLKRIAESQSNKIS